MKSKHTPGPWRADGQFIRAVDSNVAVVITNATMSGKMSPKDEADACLIAAAPELLSALKTIRDAYWSQGEPAVEQLSDLKSIASQAIAKAEGE